MISRTHFVKILTNFQKKGGGRYPPPPLPIPPTQTTAWHAFAFNLSGKDFLEIHLLIQYVTGIKISFLANLITAGDISPLELSLLSISFMYLKTVSVETNSDLKNEKNPKFIFDCFDTWVIAKVINFFSII